VFGITVNSVYALLLPVPGADLLIIFVSIRLEDSRIGRAWVAIREDEIAAKAMRHQHPQHQAAGLRHGRQFRRRRRRPVCRLPGLRQPGELSA
jgi:hypothetical protein